MLKSFKEGRRACQGSGTAAEGSQELFAGVADDRGGEGIVVPGRHRLGRVAGGPAGQVGEPVAGHDHARDQLLDRFAACGRVPGQGDVEGDAVQQQAAAGDARFLAAGHGEGGAGEGEAFSSGADGVAGSGREAGTGLLGQAGGERG